MDYPQSPACEQNMPLWIAQMEYLETQIYDLQTGQHLSVCQVTGVCNGISEEGAGSSSAGEANPSDAAQAAFDRAERAGVRGQCKYADSAGDEYQLPIGQTYYFRNRASGDIVGSDVSQPPDYQRDWEQLQPD